MMFWIDIKVTDPAELLEAALRHALYTDHLNEQEALEILKPNGEIDKHACLQMILDPGVSRPGTEIEESGVDS